jgi:hypothetical protein
MNVKTVCGQCEQETLNGNVQMQSSEKYYRHINTTILAISQLQDNGYMVKVDIKVSCNEVKHFQRKGVFALIE